MVVRPGTERGTVLVTVILFIAIAIAALAAISSSRVVSESDHQRALEQESQALNGAYGQIQLAMNVVNTSAYTDENRNIELRDAVAGLYGGTAGGEAPSTEEWMRDPTGVLHGKVRGTDVRVYHGRDYVQRIAQLRGETPATVDPAAQSLSYYVLEATGRSGDATRLVSALVRENEPFSSFVFFQNRHPLGVSGAPRGLIHANDKVEFYFPDGVYVDSVTAAGGFEYKAGATTANTSLANANPTATPISIDQVDFVALEAAADLFHGTAGLDAEIKFYADGTVRIDEFTRPRFEDVEQTSTTEVLTGYELRTVTESQQVEIGIVQEPRTREVIVAYTTETYTVDVPVYETHLVTQTREDPIYEEQQVERTRQVPMYEMQTVTCTRWVQVFVPYGGGGGSAAIGGSGGVAGEWVWQQEQYPCEQSVLVGYTSETYMATEQVLVGTQTVTWQEEVQVQVGTQQQTQTQEVPVVETETYYVDVPVYETQDVQVEREFPIYETQTQTWVETIVVPPTLVISHTVALDDGPGVIFIDGRITKLRGDVNGRVTVVGNETVRVTGNIRYVDSEGDTAMLNGANFAQPYVRNGEYDGNSVLGVIARGDILYTDSMPQQAEVNATLLAVTGRVGIDGFRIDEAGQPVADPYYGLTTEQRLLEEAYDATSYDHDRFTKESLRRLGGVISNDRILETYVQPRGDGTSYVDSGFKRGSMRFDFNLLFNPPPSFVEVPRPVAISIAPIYLMRNLDG